MIGNVRLYHLLVFMNKLLDFNVVLSWSPPDKCLDLFLVNFFICLILLARILLQNLTLLLRDGFMNVTSARVSKSLLGPLTKPIWVILLLWSKRQGVKMNTYEFMMTVSVLLKMLILTKQNKLVCNFLQNWINSDFIFIGDWRHYTLCHHFGIPYTRRMQ